MQTIRYRQSALLLAVLISVLPLLYHIINTSQPNTGLSHDELLQQKILELKERLQYAEQLHQERRRDLISLRNQFSAVIHYNLLPPGPGPSAANTSSSPGGGGGDQGESPRVQFPATLRQLLTNLSASAAWRGSRHGLTSASGELQAPSVFDYMPHLLGNPESLTPALKLSQGRMSVSLVLGIPTIHRDKQTYLYETLTSLIDNISVDEVEDVVIILMIAEVEESYIKHEVQQIKSLFSDQLSSGLLEVIVPPASYYPNFTNIKATLGDSAERTRWRTKQNLDFSFLMMYAQSKGAYYLQLEDDIVTKPGYVTTIRKFILNQKNPDWLILEFSQLGFIGKLFRTSDLPVFIQFFITFHREKPVDWLLDDVFFIKVCNPDIDQKKCQRAKQVIRKRFKPSLFQHIGLHSSLKGKNQKLKDKDFAKGMSLHRPHINPTAVVSTSLKVYQGYTIEKCYLGETYFWGLLPQPNDYVYFKLTPPKVLDRYYIKSGNLAHPDDKFFNTSIEMRFTEQLPSHLVTSQNFTLLKDNYYLVNTFGDDGIAQGNLSVVGGTGVRVSDIKLHVMSESENWVIISEIHLKVFGEDDKKLASVPAVAGGGVSSVGKS